MDERQLRELIQLSSQLGIMRIAKQMLGGRDKMESDEDKPTGLSRFVPWMRKKQEPQQTSTSQEAEPNYRERANARFDAIVKQVTGDQGGDDVSDTIRAVNQSAQPAGSGATDQEPAIDSESKRIKGQEGSQGKSQEPDGPLDLRSIITGAVEKQDSVNQGGTPVEQPEVPGIMSGSPRSETKQPSMSSNAVDALQLVLDVVGAFDPTPITDGANAAISLGRAFVTDPERRKEHLQNAAISAVSIVPYIGDTAKLAKVPRAARTVQRTSQAMRGADLAADGAKTMTAAQKRAAREQYRDTAEQVTLAAMGDDNQSEKEATTARTSPAGGSGGGSRVPPTTISTPDPDDNGNTGINQAREQAAGARAYDEWAEKLENAAGKVAEFGGTLGKGVVKAAAFVEGLKLFNNGVLAINRDLAAYNGEIAASYGLAEAADIRRDMARGRALSGPISSLNKEQSELKDKLNEALMPIENVAIRTLTEITRLTNNALDFMGAVIEIIPGAKEALDQLMKQKPDYGTAWMQFFQDVTDGKFDGKRPTFLDPKAQFLNEQDRQDVFGP